MRPGAIQVAGIHDVAEAELLLRHGVDFLGLPLRLDVHAEDCGDAEARRIVSWVSGRAECVLITYLVEPEAIAALARRIGVGWVQLHATMDPVAVAQLRMRAPELRVARSLVIRPDGSQDLRAELEAHAPYADAFLTDTFDPLTGASGATGRPHDWRLSRMLARACACPLVLAGGLTPDNVRQAVVEVRPAAVDVHTGVEGADGRKDAKLVRAFVDEARAGFADIGVRTERRHVGRPRG